MSLPYLDRAVQLVHEADPAVLRDLEAHDERSSLGQPGLDLLGQQPPTQPVVAGRCLAGALGMAHLLQPLRGTEAAVGRAVLEQPLYVVPVDLRAFRLVVRPGRAAHARPHASRAGRSLPTS